LVLLDDFAFLIAVAVKKIGIALYEICDLPPMSPQLPAAVKG
jgi:hypothetical protein